MPYAVCVSAKKVCDKLKCKCDSYFRRNLTRKLEGLKMTFRNGENDSQKIVFPLVPPLFVYL